jgi:hypothetical protein
MTITNGDREDPIRDEKTRQTFLAEALPTPLPKQSVS